MITALSAPAQQQALPFYAPEPIAAYEGVLRAMQGRYDKAYLANQTNVDKLQALAVRPQDAPAKQAYTDLYNQQIDGMLQSVKGDYGKLGVEVDRLARWVTGDGNLAAMNALHGQYEEARKKAAEDPTQLVFNSAVLRDSYFNADGSVNQRQGYQFEKREDRIGQMDKFFGNLKPWESTQFLDYSKRQNWFETQDVANISAGRIRESATNQLSNYINQTAAGSQHYREYQQKLVQQLGAPDLAAATESQKAVVARQARDLVLQDLAGYGTLYEQRSTKRHLTHDPDASAKAKEKKDSENVQTVSGVPVKPTVPFGLDGNDYDELATGMPKALDLAAMSYGERLLHTVATGGVVGQVIQQVAGAAPTFKVDSNPRKKQYLLDMVRAHGEQIFPTSHEKVLATLQTKGVGGLDEKTRTDLGKWMQRFGKEISPLAKMTGYEVSIMAPEMVKTSGTGEVGNKAWTQEVFKSEGLRSAREDVVLYDKDGNRTTVGELKQKYAPSLEKGDVEVAFEGYLTPNSSYMVGAQIGINSPGQLARVLVGGVPYYATPFNKVIRNSTVNGRSVWVPGQENPLEARNRQLSYDLLRTGKAVSQTIDYGNFQGGYSMTVKGTDPESGQIEVELNGTYRIPLGNGKFREGKISKETVVSSGGDYQQLDWTPDAADDTFAHAVQRHLAAQEEQAKAKK